MNLDRLTQLGADAKREFDERGYLVIGSLLAAEEIEALRGRFEPLFHGEFETGVFPDEWYWREGMNLPDVTRHMANAWKCDLTVARLVTTPEIGRAAAILAGWSGTRLGQDTIWMKPPNGKAIALHQDSSFLDFLDPQETVTCWITLDDTEVDSGTIEYVPGSHRWPIVPLPRDFFKPEGGYQAGMRAAAEAAGVADPDPVPISVKAGSCVFHNGRVWHGSGANSHADMIRRSIGMHLLPADVRFGAGGGGYIYGRYQRPGSDELDESFFPILWTETGYRSPHLADYLHKPRTTRSLERAY